MARTGLLCVRAVPLQRLTASSVRRNPTWISGRWAASTATALQLLRGAASRRAGASTCARALHTAARAASTAPSSRTTGNEERSEEIGSSGIDTRPTSSSARTPTAELAASSSPHPTSPPSSSPPSSTASRPAVRPSAAASAHAAPDSVPPRCDEAVMVCFSQGMTDYRWRVIPGTANSACAPSVLHRETFTNRIRLFGMPKGFPDTTAPGFQRFFYLSQASSFVSNFSSSIGYQSLLSGFFLGSSPQLWMLKDLIPALFAAYMANRVVSYENRPKFWFVVSVFMNNVTVVSDMMIPWLLPNHLLVAAIVTSTVKQSSALMYFVTRASALQHYAINNNLAELTKKFNSFGMVSYTVATALGIVYCTYIANFTVQLITVGVCCVTNMFLSSRSMTPITFRLLNFGTMKLLLRAYIMENRRIMSPREVSDLLGVRMLPVPALKKAGIPLDVAAHLVYVCPPVDKLLIRSDTLEEDVLYVNDDHMFMLAMWKPSPLPLTLRECWHRYEMPALPSFLREGKWRRRSEDVVSMEEKFRGQRLVLLVHQRCKARQLITAYLIMYTAVLRHAATEQELRRFLRWCHSEQSVWHARGDEFRELLGAAEWDVHLPMLDHHNFRMSELILPPSMRAKRRAAAGPSAPATGAAQPLV